MEKNETTFCFDFDGTIADTLPLLIKTLDKLLSNQGEEEISDDALRQIREKGIKKALRRMKIPFYKLIFVYLKIKKEMNKGILKVEIRKDVREVIKKLKRDGCRIGIITSNSKKNVNDFLKNNELDVFDFVNEVGIFEKDKIIKKLSKKGGTFIYIGDEIRDISAGKKAKVRTVAVTWGLCSKEALLKAKPDIVIEEPQELLNLSL